MIIQGPWSAHLEKELADDLEEFRLFNRVEASLDVHFDKVQLWAISIN